MSANAVIAPHVQGKKYKIKIKKNKTEPGGVISLMSEEEGCTFESRTPCEIDSEEVDGTSDNIAVITNSYDPSAPTWGGGSTPYPESWKCPASFIGAELTYKSQYKFVISGVFQYVGPLPQYNSPYPRGLYSIPQGPWQSLDGRAVLYSGTVEATCFVQIFNGPGGLYQLGYLLFGRISGDIRTRDGTLAGGVDVTDEYFGDGPMDEEARDVIDRYLSGGGCTVGWNIYVDNSMVCTG